MDNENKSPDLFVEQNTQQSSPTDVLFNNPMFQAMKQTAIKSQLQNLDGVSIRAIRAVLTNEETQDDTVHLHQAENQAINLREELANLSNQS